MLQKIQSVSNGCQVCISKWETRREILYRTTIRFSLIRKYRLCLQTKKGTLWSLASPKGMVLKAR